jgi:poly(3-hydroxybutyrate) depolymerase
VVLMPEQSQQANPQRCWNWFRSSVRVAGEATLLMAIVDHVCRHHPIRGEQVYAFGLSAGGAMALTLALRFPDRFVAVGSHSGASPHSANNAAEAAQAMRGRGSAHAEADIRALRSHLAGRTLPPLMLVHGDVDRVVSFDNAMASASLWVALAAPGVPQLKPLRGVKRGARRAHIVYDWELDGRPYIRLVRVEGLAHAWSGGTASQAFSDPAGPDALRLAFGFFDKTTKRAPGLKVERKVGRKRVA